MRLILSVMMTAALLWAMAFAVYLVRMEHVATDPDIKSDALIVLTGGNSRVEHGFALLANGSAPVLFISGVGANVTTNEMLVQHATPAIRNQITHRGGTIIFDYKASTTQTNAEQAAAFVRAHHYQKIRLITAHYHMPRSLLEFHSALPEVTILAEPVTPDEFKTANWWENETMRSLVLQEFHKYLAAQLRIMTQQG